MDEDTFCGIRLPLSGVGPCINWLNLLFKLIAFTTLLMQNEKVGSHVNCISLERQLGKVEVMGSKASQLLQKILHPVER